MLWRFDAIDSREHTPSNPDVADASWITREAPRSSAVNAIVRAPAIHLRGRP
jgi:hypothetical protein